MKRDLLLVLLLLLAACFVNFEEGLHQGYEGGPDQITEDFNDKPQESYPGQAYWTGTEWRLEP